MLTSLIVLLMVLGCGTAAMVDMSHPYDNTTIYWPGNTRYHQKINHRGLTGGGFWFETNDIRTAEHGGTHMDAPAHLYKGRWRIDDIPLDHLMGPACVIDVTSQAAENPDYRLQISDIEKFEKRFGSIPKDAIVLMNSGWDKFWPNRTAIFGGAGDDTTKLHFPGFHQDAAEWLVTNREILGMGVDTPSIDYGPSQDYPAHRKFFETNVWGLEMVKNSGQIPPSGATLYAMPMKLADGSGAATRVFAVWDTDTNTATSNSCSFKLFVMWNLIVLQIMLHQ